jgi:hypothetical protein
MCLGWRIAESQTGGSATQVSVPCFPLLASHPPSVALDVQVLRPLRKGGRTANDCRAGRPFRPAALGAGAGDRRAPRDVAAPAQRRRAICPNRASQAADRPRGTVGCSLSSRSLSRLGPDTSRYGRETRAARWGAHLSVSLSFMTGHRVGPATGEDPQFLIISGLVTVQRLWLARSTAKVSGPPNPITSPYWHR